MDIGKNAHLQLKRGVKMFYDDIERTLVEKIDGDMYFDMLRELYDGVDSQVNIILDVTQLHWVYQIKII